MTTFRCRKAHRFQTIKDINPKFLIEQIIYLFIYTLMHTIYKLKTNYQTTTSEHQAQ